MDEDADDDLAADITQGAAAAWQLADNKNTGGCGREDDSSNQVVSGEEEDAVNSLRKLEVVSRKVRITKSHPSS